jgi:hypothetical protein
LKITIELTADEVLSAVADAAKKKAQTSMDVFRRNVTLIKRPRSRSYQCPILSAKVELNT